MKKARLWLDAAQIVYTFHDYKSQGIDADTLTRWVVQRGWETLLNRAGTTFKALPESDKTELDANKAIRLMLSNPSMIKRPVLEGEGRLIVGFKPEVYAAQLGG
jgi:Spx/MgsR family transcriptional regulator